MSTDESFTFIPTTTPEADAERPILRPQRPPPPPPSPSEPSATNELTTTSTEPEITCPSTETSNENIEDNRPSLLVKFNELFDSFDYEIVRDKILTRQLITRPFTSVFWRIFLHCLPRNSCQWNQIIDGSREDYNELVENYLLNLEKIREHNGDARHLNHPLSQEENSLWNQYYVYEELKENIYQDVIRTCQEISFFRQKYILDLLLKVLYIHSRHHGHSAPYRQGMHEILAVVVYLLHSESVIINNYPESNDMMKKLYDPEYLAHDSYAIYAKIIDHLQPFYDFKSNNTVMRKNVNITDNKKMLFQRLNDVHIQMNDTVLRVNSIFERLKDFDILLYAQLQDLNIEPTVYGIRWLRLLFGREIPFGSIPSLWTVIFCYNESFAFVDYFFLALLMEIGQHLKKHDISEYSFCLQYLMQPNNISDVESVIEKALALEKLAKSRESQRFSSSFSSQTIYNRSATTGTQKPSSPSQNLSQNPLMDSIRSTISTNSLISSLQSGKSVSPKTSTESEMSVDPEKETRQQFDFSIQMQRYCAEFMTKFINRIRSRVCGLQDSNNELAIQLNGLEQIAHVLEGTLTLDDTALQALANYQHKEQPVDNDNHDTT